jgi:hypothetical protein
MSGKHGARAQHVTLSQDSSQNGVRQVSTADYPLDVRRDPNWPGLSQKAGQFSADPVEMERLAAQLEADAKRVLQVPDDLEKRATNVNYGPAEWTTAAALAEANVLVTGAVRAYAQEMAKTMDEAATAIKVAVAHLRDADGRSQHEAQRTDAALGGGTAEPTVWTR